MNHYNNRYFYYVLNEITCVVTNQPLCALGMDRDLARARKSPSSRPTMQARARPKLKTESSKKLEDHFLVNCTKKQNRLSQNDNFTVITSSIYWILKARPLKFKARARPNTLFKSPSSKKPENIMSDPSLVRARACMSHKHAPVIAEHDPSQPHRTPDHVATFMRAPYRRLRNMIQASRTVPLIT